MKNILFSLILFLTSFTFSAWAGDKINVNCVIQKSVNSLGLVSMSDKNHCRFSISPADLSKEEISPIEKFGLCRIAPFDLKMRIESFPANFASVEIKITKNKKKSLGRSKYKVLTYGNLSIGEGISSSLILSSVVNENGITCDFKSN